MLFLVFLVSSVISTALVVLARVAQRRHVMRGTDDVETAYVTSVCTLYGIFIAFMIFTVWSRYDQADMSIAQEADDLGGIYRMAATLPEPIRTEIRRLSLEYVRSVVQDEWPTMEHGTGAPRTEAIVRQMWGLYDRMGHEVGDTVIRDHMLTAWTSLAEHRRMRLLWSRRGLSPYAYIVLFVGGFVAIGLASLFTVDDVWTHIIKAASLAAVIALMLATVWALGHPFRGVLRLKPEAFEQILEIARSEHQAGILIHSSYVRERRMERPR